LTVKLLIFPFTCLLAIFITRAYHFKKKIIILFRHTHLLIIGKFISQYTHFHPIMQCYKQRAAQRKIRNVFCLGEPQLMIEKWCVTQLCHYITSLHLQLHWTLWKAVQAKNSIKTTLLALHLPKSRTKAITGTTNCGKGEKNGAQRRTKVSSMMQALELLQLAKRLILGWSSVKQWRNQACSYSHYQVTLVWRH